MQKYIDSLPEVLRKSVMEFDWAGEVMNIARHNNLSIDDADVLQHETLLVITGHSPAASYTQNLVHKLGIDHDLAEKIVDEANDHIFHALQRRSFGSANEQKREPMIEQSQSQHTNDPYLEQIDEDDLLEGMHSMGVVLVDEDENSIKDKPLMQKIPSTENPKERSAVNYHEVLSSHDLKGAQKHRTDTSILKTQNQHNPEHILEKTKEEAFIQDGRENYQKKRLDEHLSKKSFLAATEKMDLSASLSTKELGSLISQISKATK